MSSTQKKPTITRAQFDALPVSAKPNAAKTMNIVDVESRPTKPKNEGEWVPARYGTGWVRAG